MWRPLQNNVLAVRYIKDYAIIAACGAKIICFTTEMLFTFYAVECNEKWPKFL
jgi:hypothetical protein